MKRGTLLLLLALTVQGLTTFTALGAPRSDAKRVITEKEREERQLRRKERQKNRQRQELAEKQRQELAEKHKKELAEKMEEMITKVKQSTYAKALCRDQANLSGEPAKQEEVKKVLQVVEEAEADQKQQTHAVFAISFPQTKPTDESTKSTPAAIIENYTEAKAEDQKQEVATAEAQAGNGWLSSFGWGSSDKQAIVDTDKSTADDNKEKEALDAHKMQFKNALQAVPAKAKEVKENYNKVSAAEILQEQEQNGMLFVLKGIKTKAGEMKEKRQRKKMLAELKETRKQIPSTGEVFSKFENGSTRQAATTQKPHSSLWKRFSNPSSPSSIITLLQENEVPDDEVMAYQSYVNNAINTLAQAFKGSHGQCNKISNVQTRQDICQQNKAVATTLITILQLAKERNLTVSNEAQEMAAYWLEENNRAIEALLQAEHAEIKELRSVQATDVVAALLGNHTLEGRVKRFRQVRPESFVSGSNRTENMKQVMEIASSLAEELNSGERNLNQVTLFVMALQEKGISLDLESLTRLREALIQAQNQNDIELGTQRERSLLFDGRVGKQSLTLKELMSKFANVPSIKEKETPHIAYTAQFEDWNDDSDSWV